MSTIAIPMASTSGDRHLFIARMLQKPARWDAEQLRVLNYELDDVYVDDEISPYIPKDGDAVFENLSSQFADSDVPLDETHPEGMVRNVFAYALRGITSMDKHGCRPWSIGQTVLFHILMHAATALNIDADVQNAREQKRLTTKPANTIRFAIPGIVEKAALKCSCSVYSSGSAYSKRPAPLAIGTVVREPRHIHTPRDELPQILVQCLSQYQDSPHLPTYTGVVFTLCGPTLRVAKACVSGEYMQRLSSGVRPDEDAEGGRGRLRFWRSEGFDLREGDERREGLRLVMGALRFLGKARVSVDGNAPEGGDEAARVSQR